MQKSRNQRTGGNDTICNAVKNLSNCLYRYYKKKILIFLDEYDTPMQESYLYEYWEEFIAFIRNFSMRLLKQTPIWKER